MNSFSPNMDILPFSQKVIWKQLAPSIDLGFVLYGGTALALRYGHRESVDFDFFTDRQLNKDHIYRSFEFMKNSDVIQDSENTLTVLVPVAPNEHPVKVSFFGGIEFGRVGEPEMTDDEVLLVASTDDLMATKLKVIFDRVELRDYRDIAAMIANGVSVTRGLSSARLFYGINEMLALKAMAYLKDGDLSQLSKSEKKILRQTAAKITEPFPSVELLSHSLSIVLGGDGSGGSMAGGPR